MRMMLIGLLLTATLGAWAVELPLEAERFTLDPGWQVSDGGYFPAQPNLWSRTKIIADETDRPAMATRMVEIPRAGVYHLWVRFETSYGFGGRFNVKIMQAGRVVVDAPFNGIRDMKYFPFGRGPRVMGAWDWHNTDYVYQKLVARLGQGPANIIIYKAANEQPAARRVIDCLFLTDDLQLLPGDDWAQDKAGSPILSRFTVPLFVRCTAVEGGGALQVDTRLYLIGYYKGARSTYFLSGAGIAPTKPASAQWLKAREATGWQRIDVPSTMPPVLTLTPLGEGKLTVEVAVDDPANLVKRLTLTPETKHVDLVVGIGKTKYEQGLLGTSKALTFPEIYQRQIALLNAVKVDGTPATKILLATPLGQAVDLAFPLARACGLNAQFYGADPAIYGAEARLKGFAVDTGFITMQNAFMTRECYEGHFAALEAQIRQAAADQRATLGRDLPVHIKLIEEAGPPSIDTLLTYPGVKARFVDYLATQGLTLEQAQADTAKWHYHTHDFRCLLFAQTAAETTKLVEQYFPAGTTANSGSFYPTTGEYPSLIRGDDCFTLFKERGVTEFCSEMSWGLGSTPDYLGPQTQSYEAALARALTKYHRSPMGTYIISDGNRGYTGDFVELASYALLSQGFAWLSYYHMNYPGECSFLGYPDIFAGIKRVSYQVGRVEDDLRAATVRPARVALGWSLSTDIWDLATPNPVEMGPGNQVYPQERQNLYLLLRHLQFPVDLLSEDDIANGALKDYAAYVLVGDHLRPKAAEQLKAWVGDGGTLISVAGGGLLDQYNRPLDTLHEVFGITGATLTKAMPTLRNKLELLHAAPLDTITFAGHRLEAHAYRQHFTVGQGTAIGTYRNGDVAAVQNLYGRGMATIIGTLPGAAYVKPALPLKPFGRGGDGGELSQFVPTRYDATVANLVYGCLADIPRPVVCAQPLVEPTVLAAPDRYVIPLVNFATAPLKNVTLQLDTRELGELGAVRASFGTVRVPRQPADGRSLDVVIPRLDKWEVLVVARKPAATP